MVAVVEQNKELDFDDGHFLKGWDGNVFFQGTIAINDFSMVLPSLDNHHAKCFSTDQPLKSMVFRWFSQIQVRWSAMVLTLKKT